MIKDSENENERLAREWMASDNWGVWRVGMTGADRDGYRFVVVGTDEGEVYIYEPDAFSTSYALSTRAPVWPDLSHPGTRAFLLEDVRRAWGEPGLSASGWWAAYMDAPDDDSEKGEQWGVILESGDCAYGATEQAALIAALLAAPEKTK